MAKKSVNVKVTLRECGGDINKLIKRFMKKVKKEKVLEHYLDKRFYEKPSQKRRRLKKKKLENARKAEAERNSSRSVN
jgi:ribosomal protein S21